MIYWLFFINYKVRKAHKIIELMNKELLRKSLFNHYIIIDKINNKCWIKDKNKNNKSWLIYEWIKNKKKT